MAGPRLGAPLDIDNLESRSESGAGCENRRSYWYKLVPGHPDPVINSKFESHLQREAC